MAHERVAVVAKTVAEGLIHELQAFKLERRAKVFLESRPNGEAEAEASSLIVRVPSLGRSLVKASLLFNTIVPVSAL